MAHVRTVPRVDAVIVGGGISGTAAAYELARSGASVTLLEQGALASMASGWTLAGVRQSGRDASEPPLAMAAVRRWAGLGEELDADLEYRRDGNLRLARTPAEVPVIRTLVETQRAFGLDLAFLPDTAAVRAVAPALAESVLAASFCPTDGHANPVATVRACPSSRSGASASPGSGASWRRHCTDDTPPATEQQRKGGILMRVKLALVMIAALAWGLLAAAPAQSAGILRIGQNASDVGNLDPHFATTTQDRSLVDMVFNGLVRYKPGDGSIFEPDLATALPTPQMAGGKQVWTFQLRKGVMCHPTDGVPSYELTSEDVAYSLQKTADKNRSAYAAGYTGMGVEAVDRYTVNVTLDQALSPVLFYPMVANYSGGFIVCKRAAEKLGAAGMKTRPVGTGPFMFKSYRPQEKIELVANPTYFRGKPQLDGIDFRYMPDLSSRELALRNGQLDVANGAPDKAWVDKMQRVPAVKVDVFGVGEVAVLHFRTSAPPLDKVEARQAIAYALEREEFLALVGQGIGENVYSPVPVRFLAGGLTKEEVTARGLDYTTDREKAKKLLAQAGYPDGFTLEMVTSEMTGYRVLYESMQAQLAKVGIKVTVKVVDHPTMHSMIRKDANPFVIYIAWRPNADVYLTQFFHSDSIVVSGKKPNTNFSHYDKIDRLIEQARVETDAAKQVALWKEAQIKILEDMVAYPIQYQNQVYARSSAVDYGHELISVLALYPGVTEKTRLVK